MPHELYREFIDRKLTSIDGHIVDLINGLTITKILSDGVISDTTDYQTATFSDVSDYGAVIVVFKIDGNEVPEKLYIKVSDLSVNPLVYNTYIHRYVAGEITTTSINTTQYTGSFRDITVDVYALTKDILDIS